MPPSSAAITTTAPTTPPTSTNASPTAMFASSGAHRPPRTQDEPRVRVPSGTYGFPMRPILIEPTPVSIRSATPADAPRLRQIARAAYARRRSSPLRSGWRWSMTRSPDMRSRGTPGTTACCWRISRRGIGRALIAHVETRAMARGAVFVELFTLEAMTENRRLYMRLGYEEIGYLVERGYRRVLMEKTMNG
ncbi:GNAT family N-acetyltransferase [Nocardioides sp. NPDC057577]|uniref:GNAT family N-acetyltransferase n=1 Tax=Nocardioides sp. NPDC057577 TaxID=3346171 RepID=UPI003671AB62